MYLCMCMYVCMCVCIVIDCREHPSFLNGKVHVMNTTYQSRVNFTCDDGYDLVGVSYAVCLANGTWSDEIPRCISKDELMLLFSRNEIEALCFYRSRVP